MRTTVFLIIFILRLGDLPVRDTVAISILHRADSGVHRRSLRLYATIGGLTPALGIGTCL